MFFSHLREKLERQSTVVKRIKIEDSNVIFYNEGEKYKIAVDDVLLDEEFENILDAEAAVKEFLELVETEEPVAEAASSKVHVPGENFSVVPKVRSAKLYWRIEDDRGYLFDEVPVGTLGQKKFKKMYA